MHQHEAFELNFLENAVGVKRIVGDSSEVIGNLEMVLITTPNMEHVLSLTQNSSNHGSTPQLALPPPLAHACMMRSGYLSRMRCSTLCSPWW